MIAVNVSFVAQELSSFSNVCHQMLMDMQERLVYRTYIYIRSDILQYSAAQGDLAYPEKLEMMQVRPVIPFISNCYFRRFWLLSVTCIRNDKSIHTDFLKNFIYKYYRYRCLIWTCKGKFPLVGTVVHAAYMSAVQNILCCCSKYIFKLFKIELKFWKYGK